MVGAGLPETLGTPMRVSAPAAARPLPRDVSNPVAWTSLVHFPLVVVRVVDGFTMADMEDCLEPNEKALIRGQPFVTLRDFRTLNSSPDALQRKRLAKWQDEWTNLIQQNCLGIATLTESHLVRGSMKAIFWLSTPPSPEEVFLELPKAAGWLRGLLHARGVPAPTLLLDLEAGKPMPY